jgi:hypothetical protein
MALLQNKLIKYALGALVVALGFYLWSSFGGAGVSSGDLLTAEEPSESQELLVALSGLKEISLDISIFTDPIFLSLTDYGVELPQEAAGRRNPFAPVGQDGALPATTTQR